MKVTKVRVCSNYNKCIYQMNIIALEFTGENARAHKKYCQGPKSSIVNHLQIHSHLQILLKDVSFLNSSGFVRGTNDRLFSC
jgi:hypothetical protein